MANDRVRFAKMNGLGNQIIVADLRDKPGKITPQAAIALAADQKTSFDQIMAIHSPDQSPGATKSDGYIHIINSDGTDAEACGNGMRCVVKFLHSQSDASDYVFETSAGMLDAHYVSDDQISVNMGVPQFDWQQIPLAEEFFDTTAIELQIGPIDDPILHTPSVANIGNPHAIFWVEDDVWSYELDRFGPLLENHPIFPERANITIARVVSPQAMTIRTWERGAGITKACGSAACAAVVNAVRTERTGRKVIVTVPGGDLQVEWREDNFIEMTGPVTHEFSGWLDPQNGTWSCELEA